jgi:hypothetical protein
MGLKNVMQYLQQQAHVTPVTDEKNQTLQREASVYAGCTAVTAVTLQTDEPQEGARFEPIGEASNDPEPPTDSPQSAKPAPAPQGDAYQRWHDAWRQQASDYYDHHFTCPHCIAHGKGYGLKCDLGAGLWQAYCDASENAGSAP